MNTPPDNDEPFLSRWSRRKQAIAKGETLPADDLHSESAGGESRSAVPSIDGAEKRETEEELDLSTLPRVEELDERSDITAFLDRRVPAALRNAALGRMWSLDPTIRDFIEVAENQWNWNIPGGAPFHEPMEGGAEIAEQIVRGVTAAAREVVGVTETNGAGSTLVGGDSEVALASPRSDDAAEVDVAVQPEFASKGSNPSPDDVDIPSASADAEAYTQPLIAAQQSTDSAELPRRRHGGALPV